MSSQIAAPAAALPGGRRESTGNPSTPAAPIAPQVLQPAEKVSVSNTRGLQLQQHHHHHQHHQNHNHNHHYHNANPTTAILTFADVESERFQLRSFNQPNIPPSALDSNAQSSCLDGQSAADLTTPATLSDQAATTSRQARRPSPGLAARLKALGFGSRKSLITSPAQHDRIGRLPEQQLRQIDHNHQAGSGTAVIERRGRPWKGLSAAASDVSSPDRPQTAQPHSTLETEDFSSVQSDPGASQFLPELPLAKPLDMDTNKYRLPDHTNGNGTKVQPETRQEHLQRDTRPPPSPDVVFPDPVSPDVASPDLPPPPPLPKDTPPPSASQQSEFNPDAGSYFNPLGLQRPGSIYTLSRASFANQLAQLTSLQLPDAETLSGKVSALPTAEVATKALINAAEQIRRWISKAAEVIGGLDSDDDVEWAAAGGREGLEEVEHAITRFEELINVYVTAIEELQSRSDIASVPKDDHNRAVAQMEAIVVEWQKIRSTLKDVKEQVEIAMEWEELWNNVLGDIQNEMDELSRLVFEMEERRHKSMMAAASGEAVDIGDLEHIVEDTPPTAAKLQANNRFSLPAFPASPSSPGGPGISQDDSSLLALFARMQPLRASLDFLPMRLSVFEHRAHGAFPMACEELEMRRSGLDANYKKLEKDAESLRKELGEDRWVVVFRGAGRQAQKMYESVERTVSKLKDAIDTGAHWTSQSSIVKKIESYEAKKMHYGPAIERVLSIIDRGLKDRLTVNGEILRLHAEMQSKWEDLREQMRELDLTLEEVQADKRGQQLRDSISSMLSNDRSTVGSGNETPQSSPPSSVIMSSLGLNPKTPKGKAATKPRGANTGSSSHLPQPSNRRHSALPTPSSNPRKPISRLSTLSTPSRESSMTPTSANRIPRPPSTLGNRPRWNTSTTGIDTGHNFRPLSVTERSPRNKQPPTPVRSVSALTPTSTSSKLPLRSPLGRAASSSPIPEDTPSKATPPTKLSFRQRLASASPGPYAPQNVSRPRLASQASMSTLANRRASLQPPRPSSQTEPHYMRPASSFASTRRTSHLPQPRLKADAEMDGRSSPQAVAGARVAMRKASSSSEAKAKEKPRWRG